MLTPAPRGVFDPHTSADKASERGERLAAYLEKASGALSGHTVRALRADLERFTVWCGERGLCALPARSATVAEYIEAMAIVRAPATVRRYVSSIASLHTAIGALNPVQHVRVKRALQRMRRRNGCRQRQALGADLGAPPASGGGRWHPRDRRAELRDAGCWPMTPCCGVPNWSLFRSQI